MSHRRWHPATGSLLMPALLLLCACSAGSPVVSMAPPGHSYRQGDYERILARWTRSAKILNLKYLDTTLRIYVTCLSPDFIEGYVALHEALFKVPRRERNRIRDEMLATWQESYTFFFSAATTDMKWNDFAKKGSVWRIALLNDREQQVAPLEIRQEKKITETIIGFYPYVENFHRVYHLRFPRQLSEGEELIKKGTRSFALRFAGPLGDTQLVWKLK